MIHRIISDIGIEVDLILISDGIGLHEPSDEGRVHPGFVVIEAKFRHPELASILESPRVGGVGGGCAGQARRDTVLVV